MQDNPNVRIIQAAYEEFTQGAMEKLLARLDDEIVWEMPFPPEIVPYGGTHRGKAGVRAFLEKLAATTEIVRFEPGEYIASGDTVVVLGFYHGKARHTGRSAQTEFVLVFRLKNGKIISFKKFADTWAVVRSWKDNE